MSCSLLTSDLLLSAAAQCIPPMGAVGCGGGGCVCVVGGSAAQPGPTYLAALAALRAGADRVHVVCAESAAAAAVRGYGPELTVVHDVAVSSDEAAELLAACLADCRAVLVGPGLDCSPEASQIAVRTLELAVSLNKPVVVDGAALAVVARNPELLRGFQRAILTPNWTEFRCLCETILAAKSSTPASPPPESDAVKRLASRLSVALGGVCVLLKGREDAVAAGPDGQAETCALQGSGRRCSGQGALLSGLALVFAHWCFAAADARSAAAGGGGPQTLLTTPPLLRHPALLAAYAAAALGRRCAAQAFAVHRRATLSRDMVDQIGAAFCRLFPEADGIR